MSKIIEPDYMSDFACIGGDCEDTCCAGWKVIVDKKTYQKYRKVKDPVMRKTLADVVKRDRKSTSDGSYAKIVLDDTGMCPLTDDKGLCTVHKELGESYLCNTCATYPRIFADVGGTIEKTLTLSCPEATRVVLNRPEGIGFVEGEEAITALINNGISLDKYPYFWDLRIFIVQLLQDRRQSIEMRLIVLGLFLQKVETIPVQDYPAYLPNIMQEYSERLGNENYIEALLKIEPRRDFQLDLVHSLTIHHLENFTGEKYLQLVKQVVDGLNLDEKNIIKYEEAYSKYYEPFMQNHSYILENYLVNMIFKNLIPYDKVTFSESYMMIVIHVMLVKVHMIGLASYKKEMTVDDVLFCIQQIGRAVEHNSMYVDSLREEMLDAKYTTMGHMFSLLK